MKNISKGKKIIAIIIALILIAGTIMLIVKGFNKSITYQKGTKIECYIPKGYDKEDIKEIAKEVFEDKNIEIQDIEKTNQIVSVKLQNYTQEELENYTSKIAEKYNVDKEKIETYEVEVPETKISTILAPYILPVSIVTILSLVYVALRNIKEKDMIKRVAKLLIKLVASLGIYFSIIVISQIPVNAFMMPIALAVYVATLLLGIIRIQK